MSRVYHTYYRPLDFDEVVGQAHVVKPLQAMVQKGASQAYLFSGPTGVGKTTLARIVAAKCDVLEGDIVEFDASTNTGIEDIRRLQEQIIYRPFSGGNRAFIIDEAHGLSKQAWNALLKVTEEPPDYIYWFLCTTDVGKVPANVQTRFARFDLRPVGVPALIDLLGWVLEQENWDVDVDTVELAAREANGSPRQALQNLAKVQDCADAKEAAAVLASARLEGEPNVLAFIQFINGGGSLAKGMALIDALEGVNPEGVRIQTMHYLAKVARNAKNPREVLHKMEAFAQPYNTSDGRTALVLSTLRVLLD